MFFPLWFDWTWLILIPAFIITIWAQARVSNAYKKYSQIPAKSGVTGREFAQSMLRQNGVDGVAVRPVSYTHLENCRGQAGGNSGRGISEYVDPLQL